MDRSPYLAAALEALARQPQGSAGGTAMNVGASALNQFALQRNQRQMQAPGQSIALGAPSYTDATQMGQPSDPYSIQGAPTGGQGQMGGGLYGLGQRLKGMFGGAGGGLSRGMNGGWTL